MKRKLIFLTALCAAFSTFSTEYFVDASKPDDTGSATNWATAKQTIQAAVDLTVDGDIVWVTNGVYTSTVSEPIVAGSIYVDTNYFGTNELTNIVVNTNMYFNPVNISTNCVCITNSIELRSVNGSEVTVIDGTDCLRGVYMANEATLAGFTVTNGGVVSGTPTSIAVGFYSGENGGGIYAESTNCLITNCIIAGNSTRSGAYGGGGGNGGGVCGGTLINCSLINNRTGNGGGTSDGSVAGNAGNGGGAYASVLIRCVLKNNLTGNGGSCGGVAVGNHNDSIGGNGGFGGGAYASTLFNCLLLDNSTGNGGGGGNTDIGHGGRGGSGGGTSESALILCTLFGNQVGLGGQGAWIIDWSTGVLLPGPLGSDGIGAGVCGGVVQNSIVWGVLTNDIQSATSVVYSCAGNVSCGDGNITNAPLFLDISAGDFRLQSNSPCVNWGNNSYATNATDLDGNPRIVEDVVDMGAYEYQGTVGLADSDFDGIHDDWERTHGGNQNPDRVCSNGVNSILQAYIAGLNPNDPDSKFQTSVLRSLTSGNELQWQGVSGRVYAVYYSTNLISGFQPLETNIPWVAGCFTDVVHNAHGQLFYKLDVRLEE